MLDFILGFFQTAAEFERRSKPEWIEQNTGTPAPGSALNQPCYMTDIHGTRFEIVCQQERQTP